jgi:hypothetical protein
MFANFRSLLSTLLPRMSGWFFIVVLLMAAVWLLAPHQLAVSLYKLSLVTLGAVLAYWLDRSLFPYARPHEFFGKPASDDLNSWDTDQQYIASHCMLRRAIIIAAAMIAVSLGA